MITGMFNDPTIERVAAWVAVIEFLFVVIRHAPSTLKSIRSFIKSNKISNPLLLFIKSAYNFISKPAVWGTIIFFALGWIYFSLPWVLFGIAFNYEPENIFHTVVSWLFLGLSASILIGEQITKFQNVGRFIGGCLSLGGLALYYASINNNMQQQAPLFAWFVVFGIFGGILGITVGSLVAHTMNLFQIYTPLSNTRLEK
jgi:hypothetical protein